MAKQEFRVDFKDGRPFEILTEEGIDAINEAGLKKAIIAHLKAGGKVGTSPGFKTPISKLQGLDAKDFVSTKEEQELYDDDKKPGEGRTNNREIILNDAKRGIRGPGVTYQATGKARASSNAKLN